jgi:thioredoxin-like negative regulator of GroEL
MKKIFYFTSLGCIPCQTFGPTMEQISQHIPVEKITVDYEMNRAKQANVISVPTVILTENGRELRRFTGVWTYREILNFINRV